MTTSTDPLLDTIDLAAGIHAVSLTDGIVILDIDRDAYYCVYNPGRTAEGGAPPNPALRQQLIDQGLATDACAARCARVQPVTPFWREAIGGAVSPVGFGTIMRFVRVLMATTWRYRQSSLAQLIAVAERPLKRQLTQNLAVATAHFNRLCPWLPLRDRCLFRSFFQLEFYRAYGVSADWVFGVSLFPFQAHCWVADGDRLLGERLGKVEGFAIILRVAGAST